MDNPRERMRLAIGSGWKGDRCRSCKAPVTFALNRTSGKWMILDAVPHTTKGNCYISGKDALDGPHVTVWRPQDGLEGQRAAGVPFHLDHHATCPHAKDYR